MNLYAQVFLKCLNEDNVAGSGGVFGSYPSGDYAPGDTRIPHVLGAKKTKKTKKKKKKKNKNKPDMSMSAAFPAQTRGGSIFSGQGFGSHGTFPGFPS